jgi:hypothetical protein
MAPRLLDRGGVCACTSDEEKTTLWRRSDSTTFAKVRVSRRALGLQLAYLVALAVLGGLVVAMVRLGVSHRLFVAMVVAAAALVPACVGLARFVTALGSAPCPCCGVRIEGLERFGDNALQQCPRCLQYLEGSAGRLWRLGGDHVAPAATFAMPLRSEFVWPGGCAACGGAACRSVEYELDATGSCAVIAHTAGVPTTSLTIQLGERLRLKVPHCAAHNDGARLVPRSASSPARILFRSHAFLRAVVKVNGKRRLPMRHVGGLRQSLDAA